MAHSHDVIDDDRYFVIDPDTRDISHPSEIPLTLIQHDRNSERFTFELPRVIDGHDMTDCDKVQVHFINIDVMNDKVYSSSVYEANDLVVVEDKEDTLAFTWLISHEATQYVGTLNFAVRFMCTTTKNEADGTTSRIIDYSWNTKPFAGVIISEGMDYSDTIQGDYYEVIDTWLNTINSRGEFVTGQLTEHAENLKSGMNASVNAAFNAAAIEVKQSIEQFGDEVKEHLGSQTLAEMGVVSQETGNSMDKVMSQDATSTAIAAAKTDAVRYASDVASMVRSDFNARCAQMENTISNAQLYKKVPLHPNGIYELKLGKTYLITTDSPANNGWGFKLHGIVSCKYDFNGQYVFDEKDKYISAEEFIPIYSTVSPDSYNDVASSRVRTNFVIRP